jgi:hypothetical protein
VKGQNSSYGIICLSEESTFRRNKNKDYGRHRQRDPGGKGRLSVTEAKK